MVYILLDERYWVLVGSGVVDPELVISCEGRVGK